MIQIISIITGILFLILAIVGYIVPIMPGTIFLLLGLSILLHMPIRTIIKKAKKKMKV
ncbi:hypothetical protein HOD61_02755 [archaeon]|jgi:uncharacterized membrane protein YbaN (DUF454 family)|nr:hypothetical protein [archaeon]